VIAKRIELITKSFFFSYGLDLFSPLIELNVVTTYYAGTCIFSDFKNFLEFILILDKFLDNCVTNLLIFRCVYLPQQVRCYVTKVTIIHTFSYRKPPWHWYTRIGNTSGIYY